MTTHRSAPAAPPAGAPVAPPRGWYRLTVTEVDRLTADTTAVTFRVPPELRPVFAHRPGQHLVVRYRHEARELRRSYSLCPPPTDPAALRLVVKRNTRDGFGAHAATRLTSGDALELSPPTGNFGLPATPAAHHVLIAGGCGVTPLAPMAAAALREDPGCRVSLVHAVRTAGDALLADELAELKDAHLHRFTTVHVLSREQQGSDLLTGRLDAAKLGRVLDLLEARTGVGTTYSLCGPHGLVATARTLLAERGAPPATVRWELFSADGLPVDPAPAAPAVPADGTQRRITAVLAGRTSRTVMGPEDRVALDAVLRVRPEVPYSCREGVCGNCRAKVVRGAVTLAPQHALDPRDRAAGYTLACRARPRTDDLTLDFDA